MCIFYTALDYVCVCVFTDEQTNKLKLRQRQFTLERGPAGYVNVWGSVHWEGVYNVGECTLGVQIFSIIEVDQSETTNNYMFNASLKFTNHKCLMTKQSPRVKC